MDALVAAVMAGHRCGAMLRAVLCDLPEDDGGETSLEDSLADADGKVAGREGKWGRGVEEGGGRKGKERDVKGRKGRDAKVG